ncbi:MAG: histone deacetylase, partial [Thermoanaerobaculia bacterium]
GDADYLAALDRGLERALVGPPDLAFYIAGADPFREDRYGRLAVSRDGLAERDRRVFAGCTAAGVPVTVVMGGGYATLEAVVSIHLETVRLASESLGGVAGAPGAGG